MLRQDGKSIIERTITEFSEIRHNAGAHREHDFMKQMEVLEGVGWSGTIDRLHRFEEVTLELGKTMKPLMEAGLKKIGEAFGK